MRLPPVILGLALISVLLPAVMLAAVSVDRWHAMQRGAEADTTSRVTLLEQQARHVLETQSLVLDLLEDLVGTRDDAALREAGLSARLAELAQRLPQTVSIWVSNAAGAVVAASIPTEPGTSIAAREDVQAQQSLPRRDSISAPYIGPISQRASFAMTRRRPSAEGDFAGVLRIAVSPDYLTALFRTALQGDDGAASLVREDGTILARAPAAPDRRQLGPDSPLVRAMALAPQGALIRDTSTLDGVSRVYAYRRVAGFPLVVGYGVDLPRRVAAWRAQVLRDAGFAVAAMALLGLATWLAARAIRAREAALAALRQETERRLAVETRLEKARSLEALGRMARGVAHDINNLLTVVVGNLETLEEGLADTAQRGVARRAHQAAEAGARLTGSLLAYARTQVLRVEPVAIAPLVEELRPVLQDLAGPGIPIALELAPGLPACLCDPAQLRAALGNLVSNARDAMPQGGRIRIAAQAVTLGEAELAGSAARPGRFVALGVTDTGHGMPREVAAHVFEPFFTTKPPGRASGLGLSHVEGLVVQLGGRVRLWSAPGQGTSVTLELPAAPDDVQAIPVAPLAAPAPAPPSARLGRVLLVDDQPEIGQLAARVLTRAGHAVTVATGAADALARVEAGEGFDLLLSDIVMPGTLDGVALLAALRRRLPALAGLLMSGYAPDTAALRAADAGFIGKPFTRQDLLDAVARALARETAG